MQGPDQDAASSKFRDYPIEIADRDRKRSLPARSWRAGSGPGRRSSRRSSGPRPRPGGTTPDPGASTRTSATARSSSWTPTRSSPTCPRAHVLHVVRNPWSAYADTKKRAVPLSLPHYLTGWCINQMAALTYSAMFPGRVHVLRFEDIVADPVRVLGQFLDRQWGRPVADAGQAELERQAAGGSLPLGHRPHPHAGGQPGHRRGADGRRKVDEIRARAGVLARRLRVYRLPWAGEVRGMTGLAGEGSSHW